MATALKVERSPHFGGFVLAADKRRRLTWDVYTGWLTLIKPTKGNQGGQII